MTKVFLFSFSLFFFSSCSGNALQYIWHQQLLRTFLQQRISRNDHNQCTGAIAVVSQPQNKSIQRAASIGLTQHVRCAPVVTDYNIEIISLFRSALPFSSPRCVVSESDNSMFMFLHTRHTGARTNACSLFTLVCADHKNLVYCTTAPMGALSAGQRALHKQV